MTEDSSPVHTGQNDPRPYFQSSDVTIWHADSRDAWRDLPEHSADAIVTSPPYFGLRDYGHDGQIGLETSPAEYVDALADLLTGYGDRVLKPGGSLWLNLGDTYAGAGYGNHSINGDDWQAAKGNLDRRSTRQQSLKKATAAEGFKPKCLLMIPERVALALIERGWILRNKVIWAKPNGMPSSVTDRLATKHETLFHLVRQPKYVYDLDAIREPHSPVSIARAGRQRNPLGPDAAAAYFGNPPTADPASCDIEAGKNPGDWWVIPTQPYPDAHFAVFPPELVRRPILATVPEGGTVLDPFFGSGTTAVMARRLGRKAVGVELSADYCALAAARFRQDVLDFGGTA